jgi:SPP1 family predicted phage head-tail adaptor
MQTITSSLRKRVQVQKPSTIKDAYGQPVSNWTTVATVWANIHALTMRELFNAGTFASQVSHKITIRYPFANFVVNPGDRLLYYHSTQDETHIYKVQSPNDPDQRNRVVEILAIRINEGD